ncbi:MAG: deoxyribonuclease V [Planctomycetota bacterium]|nr:MAG: deoxyribonuclease V [Planctomycetota bacterium]
MDIKQPHNWNLSCAQARDLQNALARKVRSSAIKRPPKTVAGIDCAFSKDKTRIGAIIVVLEYQTLKIIETVRAVAEVGFPYISGLLSFREAPVCVQAAKRLKITPDIFLIDGQGIAHPRRLGLASHLGLFLDKPTVGCAKSRLIGKFQPPPTEKGSYSPLTDKNEIIGAVLRTRTNVKPLFVSTGHKCTLDDAIKITLACTPKYRLPEPTRLAHQMITRLKPEI